MKTAIILSIGDELVLGQTVDTNSAWISQQLAAVGCAVIAHATVGDDQSAIESAMREAIGRCDYLIVSGGIGPTEDDLTRQALAAVLNSPLELNQQWLESMNEFFRKLNRSMPATNQIQAMIPRGATMIANSCGTAAGIQIRIGARGEGQGAREEKEAESAKGENDRVSDSSSSCPSPFAPCPLSSTPRPLPLSPCPSSSVPRPCLISVMPGVPKEMKAMFTRDVLPHVTGEGGGAVILSRTLHTFGLGESSIAEMLGPLMKRDRNPSVGTTVANGIVSLRLNARFDSKAMAQRELDATSRACREVLGDLIFGEDDESLPQVIARLLVKPVEDGGAATDRRRFRTVTTAESCTGGLLAKMLTDIPGSSDYFKTGFVTYSNQSKYDRLGVSMEIINVFGAVSENVVSAMSRNARRLSKADFALAISGIAGPGGGSATKPVGTVCIALAFDDETPPKTRTFNFAGDRETVRDRAAKMALTMLRFHLLNKPMPF